MYYRRLELLARTAAPQTCELRLRRVGGGVSPGAGGGAGGEASPGHFWAHLDWRPRCAADAEPLSCSVTFTDITEHRDAAEVRRLNTELKNAHLLLEETQAISELGGWEYDVTVRHLTWTEEVRRIFGVGADYDPNDASRDIGAYAPRSAPLIAEAFRRALDPGEPYDLELEFEHADGVRIWIRSIGRPVILNGAVLYVVGSIMDITARKQAEESLRRRSEEVARQQAFLATLLETIPSPVFYKDAAGVYLGCNPAFERLLGRERGEIVGNTAADLGPLELAERYAAMDQRLFEQPGTQTYEWPIKAADGCLHDVIFNKATFNGAGGQLAGMIGVVLDITARKQMEEALRQSEAQLRTLINTIPDLVWLKDPEGVYLSCDRRFESFFGAPEEDIVGKTDSDFMDKDLADSFRQHDRAAVAAGIPTANEEEIVFAEDGHREILETIKTPIHAGDGRLIGVLGVGRDITQRKHAEEALRTFERLFRGNPTPMALNSLPELEFADVNDAFLSALGYSREEIIGHTGADLELFIEPRQQFEIAGALEAHTAASPIASSRSDARTGPSSTASSPGTSSRARGSRTFSPP